MLVVIVLVVVVVDEFRFLLVPRGFVSLRIGILTPCFAKHWDNAVGAIITISFPILSLSLSLFLLTNNTWKCLGCISNKHIRKSGCHDTADASSIYSMLFW